MASRRRAPGILGSAGGSRFFEDGSARFGNGDVYDPDTKRVRKPRRNFAAEAVERSVGGDKTPAPPPFRRPRTRQV